MYEHGLCHLFLAAVQKILGNIPVEIQNSLNKGLYIDLFPDQDLTENQVNQVASEMDSMVKEDIPFVYEEISTEKALKGLEKKGLREKRRILQNQGNLDRVGVYRLGDYENYFYGPMVPSTGYLKLFELRKYKKGVLLRFPTMTDPGILPPYEDQAKMYQAFAREKKWQDIMEISYVSDLNDKIKEGTIGEIIQLEEALHEKEISLMAEEIRQKNKRIILIAGPSSSGKTTFARRLCIHLRVLGLKPLYLGTDDYFIDRKYTPLDENGEKDFESLRALDLELFNRDMNGLLRGETVDLPQYDFIEGKKKFGFRRTRIEPHQPVVIEGIHGLNGKLTEQIVEEEKYKIYISPLTQLSLDRHNRISTTDARMLRRMATDYKYRGYSAAETILAWPKVRRGEDVNIFPYNGYADAFFNSAYVYEISVLKAHVAPLLEAIGPEEETYSEAKRMLDFLRFFETMDREDSQVIVNHSILREFIGDGSLKKEKK